MNKHELIEHIMKEIPDNSNIHSFIAFPSSQEDVMLYVDNSNVFEELPVRLAMVMKTIGNVTIEDGEEKRVETSFLM